MLFEAGRILTALDQEFSRLAAQLGDHDVDGSSAQAIGNALQLLRNRERGDVMAVRGQFGALGTLLDRIDALAAPAGPELASAVAAIRATMARVGFEGNLRLLESSWRDVVRELEQLMTRVRASGLADDRKMAIGRTFVAWESGDLLTQAASGAPGDSAQGAVEIQTENLTAYLRDRLGDPGLRVTTVCPLAGGFGKQTVLFDVEGTAMSGGFVMRRDIGRRASVPNDCHLTRQEFPVIMAARARQFPAPDALWVDTEHRLLPGGDFIIMRRSPGKLAGNFFGARTAIPPSLVDSLADIAARLHALPPLYELGNLTDSIRADVWNLPLRHCTERYIRNWYELFLREDHTPSPALIALYDWLLENVPDRQGRPVLLHGDIGFHNFLFDGDRLAAVLDWEFAHIGDPAEELGYIKVTVGAALDWERLMARYQAAGGSAVDPATLRYFQVWAYARNATAANLLSTLFNLGEVDDLKLAFLPVGHFPHFLRGAQALIDAA